MSADVHRARFRLKTALAAGAAGLFVLTLIWPDWIELTVRVDPDGGSGSLELLILASALLLSLAFSLSALADRRRRPAPDSGPVRATD